MGSLDDRPEMAHIREGLANIDKAERAYQEAGAKYWLWSPERRQAALRGEMLPISEADALKGEVLALSGTVPRVSPYAEFFALRMQLQESATRVKASMASKVEAEAKQRMAVLLRQAGPHVEKLLEVAEEVTALNRQVATCRTLARPAPTGGFVQGPRTQPRERIDPGDVVDAVLDPTLDLFAPVPVGPRDLRFRQVDEYRPHIDRPEPAPEPPSEELLEAMAKEKQQRAARLGVHPSRLRS